MTTYPYPCDSSHGMLSYEEEEKEEEDIVQLTEEEVKEVLESPSVMFPLPIVNAQKKITAITEELNRMLREKQS